MSDFWGSRKTLLHVEGHVVLRPAILCILNCVRNESLF